MKQLTLTRLLIFLRAFMIVLIISLFTHLLCSFTANRLADDFWKQLGISEMNGTENIKSSFLENYFHYYGARNAKNIITGNRAAVAKELLEYSKKTIHSAAFKNEYDKLRAGARPEEPLKKIARPKAEIQKEKIAEMEEAIKKMENGMKDMTPDMQKMMKPSLELYQQQIKDYKDPNSKMIELFVSAEKFEVERLKTDYEEKLLKWQQQYPAETKDLIKNRLEHYLEVAATVDFNAKLVEKNRKQVFVNPKYESKNYEWKMIYRAGKEVYDVTVPFVKEWMNELK